jgi:isoleucyl-tRNA synthetase
VPQEVTDKLGAEIVRLWVASTDYSGDLNIDDKILARVVDTYRRVRNTLKFLLANTSDFDIHTHAVPLADMLEVDRYALSRAAQLQHDIVGQYNPQTRVFEGGHFGKYEFHPVVSKLQVYCSEDLGAFYLDVLKDRLYTTAANSHARRSAQTALWQITQAMLRWMAPFLSFTAEEAWGVLGLGNTIFKDTYVQLPAPDATLLDKWSRIRDIRELVNKEIEVVRSQGLVGSPLQADIKLTVNAADMAVLQSLGADVKFVFIVSSLQLMVGNGFSVDVAPSENTKCERCWHYSADVGSVAAHPGLCARCDSNLHGSGEQRACA